MNEQGTIIAGTGHRPSKLGGYERLTEVRCIRLAMDYLKEFRKTTEIKAVISGMALGWDQALAEAALLLQIPLLCYVPCRNMGRQWTTKSKERWERIMNRSSAVFSATKDDYMGPYCMQKRNEMMVDDCDMLLSLWDGTDGGTANCIGYANRKRPGLGYANLWPEWVKLNQIATFRPYGP